MRAAQRGSMVPIVLVRIHIANSEAADSHYETK
jgi:hypothetical protein